MSSTRNRALTTWIGLGVVAAGVVPAHAQPSEQRQMAQLMANRHAKRVCSGVFLSGREPAAILEQDHDTSADSLEYEVNRVAGVVTVDFAGLRGRAAYRPGLGCPILYRLRPEQLLEQTAGAARSM